MGNSLALCMMVKNEEKYLPYALASVYQHCDEIIIVDTGSTDKTIEIAKAFGAYIIQAEWRNDFALIRNIAQSAADSEWILWLDGDEVFSESGISKIKNQLLYDNTANFFLMPRVNFWKDLGHAFLYPDSQYKIYRNHVGLHWKNKIHEKIYFDNDPEHRKKLKHTDVTIYHYAYMKSPDEVKKKMGLYIKIENPDMADDKIDRCSIEHSFFFNKQAEGVQDYNGNLPEIFDKLNVTDTEIKWSNGQLIHKFGSISVPKFQPIQITPVKSQNNEISQSFEKDMISFVIATYNKIEYVQPLVRDLYNSVHTPFEIIIVNNGSTEQNVIDYLSTATKEKQNIKYINLDKNYGFAKGYNEGVKIAKGEWICILNNDVLPTDFFSEKMIAFLKDDPEVAMVGPVSNNIHGENQMFVNIPPNYTLGDFLVLIDKNEKENLPKRMYSSWLTGCVLMFNRNLLNDLAKIQNPPRNGILFNEDFLVGCGEDTDLDFYVQHRLHKKLGVERTAFVWHHGNKTLETISKNWREEIQSKNDKILRQRWPEIFPNG